ncbi:MAG: hypothetical protein HY013_16270 [Candidatus Solibacter usitatus]|nr:hypothetical protein [Candidatus Solibacter usitatus]
MAACRSREPDEIDLLNFAPRVTLPVLMLNGRDDFTFPLQSAQRPLFGALGTPSAGKRHVLFNGGHVASFPNDALKEALEWLDRYLGPVALK